MFNAHMRCIWVLLCGIALSYGCNGTPNPIAKEKGTLEAAGPNSWVDNPGSIRDHLAAVGTSVYMGNLQTARLSAETNGRAQLAATLKAQIQQLVEDWAKTAGDLNRAKETLTSLVNNESFTRMHVDTVIKGSRPMKYFPPATKRLEIQDPVFCLVVLEDPTGWVANIDTEMEDALVKDEVLWKTEAMKAIMRERMDNLKKANKQERINQLQKVAGSVPKVK